jgi:hypothetical protein
MNDDTTRRERALEMYAKVRVLGARVLVLHGPKARGVVVKLNPKSIVVADERTKKRVRVATQLDFDGRHLTWIILDPGGPAPGEG